MLSIGKRDAAGLSDGQSNKSQASDRELFNAIRTELDAVKSGVTALTVKIDADSGDTGGDNDYESTLSLGLNLFQK